MLIFTSRLCRKIALVAGAVDAYIKVVLRRKSSSADGKRGGRAREGTSPLVMGLGGLPRENFEFLALLCTFLMGFYAFEIRFQSRFFARKDIFWRVNKPNANEMVFS